MKPEKKPVTKTLDLNSRINIYAVEEIIYTLRKRGFETYLVGGAVRDILINKPPKDYDISTAATPEQLREIFSKKRAKIIGRRFKIVHLRYGQHIIEISTFRKNPTSQEESVSEPDEPEDENIDIKPYEHYEKIDHSSLIIRNDNEYGTSCEDAWRRDFTVNSIFYDPFAKKLIDYTGHGLSDLEKGIVRAIGDPLKRFSEDPVRMLRALKLVAQYGYSLEEKTEAALLKMQMNIKLASISRLTLELEKIILKQYAYDTINVFYQFGFLSYFMPFFHSKYQTPAAELAMELLKARSTLLSQSKIPSNITSALAVMALPFIAAEFAGNHKAFLHFYGYEEKKPMRRVLRTVFSPLCFPRWVICDAVDSIFLQNKIFSNSGFPKLRRHRSFNSAMDLSKILDEAKIINPDLEKSSEESDSNKRYLKLDV